LLRQPQLRDRLPVARRLPCRACDRASDIWEPLLALAELAGEEWAGRGREAPLDLTAEGEERSPIGSLLLDIRMWPKLIGTKYLFARRILSPKPRIFTWDGIL